MSENSKTKQSGYKALLSNTIIFAIGSFSSKVLAIVLVSVYMNILTTEQVGLTDNFTHVANWLLPVVSLTVSEAVIRFGLDKSYDKRRIFSISSAVIMAGCVFMAVVVAFLGDMPFVHKFIGSYAWLLFAYVAISSYKTVCATFVRAMERVKLFAASGILGTFFTLVFSVLFLVVFKMGAVGYILSIVLADLVSIIFLMFRAKLWRFYIPLSRKISSPFDEGLAGAMLRYCIPLIPTQLLWLITNSSDSFMVTSYISLEANGILSAAYKIPNLLTTIYMMFGQAWNMSAITENDSEERSSFYSNVFDVNQSMLYIIAAGILMIIKPLTRVWLGDDFQSSVLYSPGLVFSTVFICFTTFMGTVYVVTKKSKKSLVTSLIAGIINVSINIWLIPRIGLYGAVISTIAAYIVVFVVRALDAKRLIDFDIKPLKILINTGVLAVMTVCTRLSGAAYAAVEIAGFAVVTVINYKCMLKMARLILPKRIQRFVPFINKF